MKIIPALNRIILLGVAVSMLLGVVAADKKTDWDEMLKQATLTSNLPDDVIQLARSGDVASLYRVAKDLKETNFETALTIQRELADATPPHIPSQFEVGMMLYGKGDRIEALRYFSLAGEAGPHQAALYNAGLIYSEAQQWVPALLYIQAAAMLPLTHPDAAEAEQTETCIAAHESLSQHIAGVEHTLEEAADLFLFGSPNGFPYEGSEERILWETAMIQLVDFNQTFVATNGQGYNRTELDLVAHHLGQIWEQSAADLAPLQDHILLVQINACLRLLASEDDRYVTVGAIYAEELARSRYCYETAAVVEYQPACFNQAVSDAISYYRRANDVDGTKRVFDGAGEHPVAATHWKLVEQTPPFFHPKLQAHPWWEAEAFPIAVTAKKGFATYRTTILGELKALQALPEAFLDGRSFSSTQRAGQVQNDGTLVMSESLASGLGFRSSYHPNIRSSATSAAWSEYGPLFDGREWSTEKCLVVPTLCQILQDQVASLCTRGVLPRVNTTHDAVVIDPSADVIRVCGSHQDIVTILRVRPGTQLLPHNGVTNRRLTLHWCIGGCKGVEYTVGGKTLKDYGGNEEGLAVVFDDSFEYSLLHQGSQDLYVVQAILAHPDAPIPT